MLFQQDDALFSPYYFHASLAVDADIIKVHGVMHR